MIAAATAAAGAALSDLRALAFPVRCGACGGRAAGGGPLCAACEAAIPRLATPLCAACLVAERDPSGCTAHPRRRVWAAWVYDARAALVVHALKYDGRTDLAGGLGAALAAALPAAPAPEIVAPVPLHPSRRRERGYDQAALLAEAVATRAGAPCVPGLLARVRATPAQARLGPARRRANVAGAFAVTRPSWVRGRRVLVVDDVTTTGATLAACLAALEAAGAEPEGAALAWAA